MFSHYSAIFLLATVLCTCNALPTQQQTSENNQADQQGWRSLSRTLNIFRRLHSPRTDVEAQDMQDMMDKMFDHFVPRDQSFRRLRNLFNRFRPHFSKDQAHEQTRLFYHNWPYYVSKEKTEEQTLGNHIGDIGKSIGEIVDRFVPMPKQVKEESKTQEQTSGEESTTDPPTNELSLLRELAKLLLEDE